MPNARGANGQVALAFATAGYGTIPTTGFRQVPVSMIDLGEDQDLLDADELGYGRDPQEAGDDVVKAEGSVTVPVDLRNFGLWLRLVLGNPVTTAGIAATGSIQFTSLPVTLSTITVNGVAITLTTGTPTAGQVKIEATIAATVANIVAFLNASVDPLLTVATYFANLAGDTVQIAHKTMGTSGNSFTLAKGTTPNPNCVLSAATLTGGAATGAYNHVFTAGQQSHPDAAVQVSFPEVPHHGMNYGVMGDGLSIQMQRSGLLKATLPLVAQGENTNASSMAGTLATSYELERFSQFAGLVEQDGVPLGKVESATLRIGNNLDKDESIRPDGRIGGADPGKLDISLDVTIRFADRTLFNKATARTPIAVRLGWQISAVKRLDFIMERVRLPRRKVPLSGPGGIRVTFQMKPTENFATQRTLRAVLVNDVASY